MIRNPLHQRRQRFTPARVQQIPIDPERWMTWEEVAAAVGDAQLAATLLQQGRLPAAQFRPKSRDTLGRVQYEQRWARARVSLALQDLRATNAI
jgi:hypothetical protein